MASLRYLFLEMDVKYDGKQLKILEFQDGPTAGLRAYDEVAKQKGEIWHAFWQYLATFSKPVWYVGPQPEVKKEGVFSHNDRERVRFDDFLAMGGRYVASLNELESDEKFIELVTKSNEERINNYKVHKNFDDYKGIILLKLTGQNNTANSFKKKYPDFLIINQWSRRVLNDKRRTHKTFEHLGLQKYRPWCKILPKKYVYSLAQTITKQCKSPYYVIKPINSGRSNGVIVADHENLNVILKKILFAKRSLDDYYDYISRSYRPKKPLVYSYWQGDQENYFMIEEYIPSKPIEVSGKPYDPTARMVFVVTNNAGKITFTFLRSFWKIPSTSLNEGATLTEQHVSKYRNDLANIPFHEIIIDENDLQHMQRLALKALFPLYLGTLAAY